MQCFILKNVFDIYLNNIFCWFVLLANSAYTIVLHCHHYCHPLPSLYTAPSHMFDASEFTCGIYSSKHFPLMHTKEFGLFVVFYQNIYSCHIYGNGMVNKCWSLVIFERYM